MNTEPTSSMNKPAEKLSKDTQTSKENLMAAAASAGSELSSAAKTEFDNIMADLQDLVTRAGKLSGQELGAIRQQISTKLSLAKEKLSHVTEDASLAAHKGMESTEQLIKQHPLQAVGIAALAGMVFGCLISRR